MSPRPTLARAILAGDLPSAERAHALALSEVEALRCDPVTGDVDAIDRWLLARRELVALEEALEELRWERSLARRRCA